MRVKKQKEFELERYTQSPQFRAKKVKEVSEKRLAESEKETERRLNKQKKFFMVILFLLIKSPFCFFFTLCQTFLTHFLNFFCSKLWGLCISIKLKLFLFIESHFFFFFTFCSTFLPITLFDLFFSLFSCFR